MSDLTSDIKADLKHLETIASTVLGLAEGPVVAPAKALLKKASDISIKLDGGVPDAPKVFPPVVVGPKGAAKAAAAKQATPEPTE